MLPCTFSAVSRIKKLFQHRQSWLGLLCAIAKGREQKNHDASRNGRIGCGQYIDKGMIRWQSEADPKSLSSWW